MRIGVLGGGQLGRMLGIAALPLGIRTRFFDPDPHACARDVGEHVCAAWTDRAALERFAQGLDGATIEFENVPVEALRVVQRLVPVAPSPRGLEVAQDRVDEKRFFARAGLSVHPWTSVDTLSELHEGVRKLGLPCVLKTRRGGYDGKGQAVLREASDTDNAWREIGARPAILEAFVQFERELSIIAVRGRDGAFATYPVTQNRHERGVLRESVAPATNLSPGVAHDATSHVRTLMASLDYVGVLAVEFFEAGGRLLANEMAPRVHNSGHWTIDGARTSQFENHVRAVAGLPLGDCSLRAGPCAMVNFIGNVPSTSELLAVPGARAHLYGKQGRAGRKVAHATLVAPSDATIDGEQFARLRDIAKACDEER